MASNHEQQQAMTPLPLLATSTIDAVLNKRHQSLGRQTPWKQWGRQGRQTTLMPQGSLANERDKNVVRAPWVSGQNASRDDNYHRRGVNWHNACTPKQSGGPSLTGSFGQIRQIHALGSPMTSVRINKNSKNKLQQTNTAAATHAPCITREKLTAWIGMIQPSMQLRF